MFSPRITLFLFPLSGPFSAPDPGGIPSVQKPQRLFRGAGFDAPGAELVFHAKVAAHGFSRFRIHDRSAEGTGIYTGSASDTCILIRDDGAAFLADAGVHRAYMNAHSLLTGLAQHRDVGVPVAEFLDPDPLIIRAARIKMPDGACHLAAAASRAFLRIYHYDLICL